MIIVSLDKTEPRLELFDEETEHTLSIIPWVKPELYVTRIPYKKATPSKPLSAKQEEIPMRYETIEVT